jgi:NitT/TauT family transport system ATP-binding protein
MMIELNNISKNFDSLQVLKDFNISFKKNEISCLFGPSGVGKTTIANIVAKLVTIETGTISGIENSLYSYVFQEPRLLKWYSVYDNIDFVLQDLYDNEKRKIITSNYIDMVELSEYKDYKPKTLSGGMAQRVSLARAFAYPSDILIMDEPFKGLDLKLKQEMMLSFQKLWQESKRTVIFITHDVDEAILLSDTIFIIKNRPAKIIKTINKQMYSNFDDIKNIMLTF